MPLQFSAATGVEHLKSRIFDLFGFFGCNNFTDFQHT